MIPYIYDKSSIFVFISICVWILYHFISILQADSLNLHILYATCEPFTMISPTGRVISAPFYTSKTYRVFSRIRFNDLSQLFSVPQTYRPPLNLTTSCLPWSSFSLMRLSLGILIVRPRLLIDN